MKIIYVVWGIDKYIAPQALAFCTTEKVARKVAETYESHWDKMFITEEELTEEF